MLDFITATYLFEIRVFGDLKQLKAFCFSTLHEGVFDFLHAVHWNWNSL